MDFNAWVVLICDPETATWTVAVNISIAKDPDAEDKARLFYDELRLSGDNATPAIVLYTGDFVQF